MTIRSEFTQELESKLTDIVTLWDATNILENEELTNEIKDEIYTSVNDLATKEIKAMEDFMTDLRKFLGTGKEKLLIQKCWSFDIYTMLGEELEHRKEEEKENGEV